MGRDGVGEGNCIANFANTRHLTLPFGGRSLLAVALDLSQRVRGRRWELCDFVCDDGDRLFVNMRDIPTFEGARAIVEDCDTRRATTHYVKNIMEMFVDKETEKSWALLIGIREDLDGNRFAQSLKKALWSTAVEPLGPAIPT